MLLHVGRYNEKGRDATCPITAEATHTGGEGSQTRGKKIKNS